MRLSSYYRIAFPQRQLSPGTRTSDLVQRLQIARRELALESARTDRVRPLRPTGA